MTFLAQLKSGITPEKQYVTPCRMLELANVFLDIAANSCYNSIIHIMTPNPERTSLQIDHIIHGRNVCIRDDINVTQFPLPDGSLLRHFTQNTFTIYCENASDITLFTENELFRKAISCFYLKPEPVQYESYGVVLTALMR